MNEQNKDEHLKSMSLGDHLDELRARLILTIMGLFIGLVVCLFFGNSLITFMSKPFNQVIEKLQDEGVVTTHKEQDITAAALKNQAIIVTHDTSGEYHIYTSTETIGSLLETLRQESEPAELSRTNLQDKQNIPEIYQGHTAIIGHHPNEGFIVYTSEGILDELLESLKETGAIIEGPDQKVKVIKQDTAVIVTHGPVEGFMVYIKTCMLFGLLFTSPWAIWHIWAFVSTGLYQKEKRYVHFVAPASALLFVTGTLFFILGVAPQMMGFLIRFDAAMGVRSFWSLQKYINMVFALTLVFGAAFQMPIAIVFAEHLGLVTVDALAKNRKFVALGLVIVAAMATPPDVISQVSLSIPLYGLYEASILFCRIKRKRKSAVK